MVRTRIRRSIGQGTCDRYDLVVGKARRCWKRPCFSKPGSAVWRFDQSFWKMVAGYSHFTGSVSFLRWTRIGGGNRQGDHIEIGKNGREPHQPAEPECQSKKIPWKRRFRLFDAIHEVAIPDEMVVCHPYLYVSRGVVVAHCSPLERAAESPLRSPRTVLRFSSHGSHIHVCSGVVQANEQVTSFR